MKYLGLAILITVVFSSVSIARAEEYTFCTDMDYFRIPDTDIVLRLSTDTVCTYMNNVFFAKLLIAGFKSEGMSMKEKVVDLQMWLSGKVKSPKNIAYRVYRSGLGGVVLTVQEGKK